MLLQGERVKYIYIYITCRSMSSLQHREKHTRRTATTPGCACVCVCVYRRSDRVNIKRYIGIITTDSGSAVRAAVASLTETECGVRRARSAKWLEGLKDPIKPYLRRRWSSRVTAKRQLLHTPLLRTHPARAIAHRSAARAGGRVMNEPGPSQLSH